MNLEDLIDENGLQQDEWSLTRPNFGEDNQLTVVGWSGKSGANKLYILKCDVCSEDTELFGEGYFVSNKSNLKVGQISCGCTTVRWSAAQYETLCSRKAKELGYIFLGFIGSWKDRKTKIKMFCEKHGEWQTGSIRGLIDQGSGCIACKAVLSGTRLTNLNTKPDDIMIASFFASGAFHPDTKFWRSDRKSAKGCKTYWFMDCPDCSCIGESYAGNLQKGRRSCGCSTHRQQECYVNIVVDGGYAVAIKFGISNNSTQRLKQQQCKCTYGITKHSVYKFPDVSSCKNAERECKMELECGVLLKYDMPDGYTETTWVYNLEKIIEIYERNGGIRQENP